MRIVWWLILALCCLAVGSRGWRALAHGPDAPSRPVEVELTDGERAWLAAHPEVRWGADPHWPPFSQQDEHAQLIGIDAELTRLTAARVGLRIVPVPSSSWSDTLAKARRGEVDFLSATARTEGRLQEFLYSAEYGAFPVVIVTRKDTAFLTSLHKLRFSRIALNRDAVIAVRFQQDYPETPVVLTDTAEEALLKVVSSQADATVQNLAVASHLIHTRGMGNLKISGVTDYEFPLRFAVRQDFPELVSILNKGLASISRSEREVIYARYLHPDISQARDWGAWRRRASYAVLAGIGIGAVLLVWNRSLVRQIRHRQSAEAALRETGDSLAQRTRDLDQRVAEVEQLNRRLLAANSDLDAFSASVSHDLRSPLRRATSFVGLLQEHVQGSLDQEDRQFLAIITAELARMNQLINDLLNFARVGRVTLQEATVNMAALVRGVIDDLRRETRGREVHWDVRPLPDVVGDPSLLRQVVANLVDNALKYSRRQAETRIEIGTLPHRLEEMEITFYVRDNGVGFDMKYAGTVFDAFRRLHNVQEFEGTGLGLTNVQRIILRHGGRVWAEGELGKGATFYFTLFRKEAPVGRA